MRLYVPEWLLGKGGRFVTSVAFPKGAHSLGNIKRTLHPPESRKRPPWNMLPLEIWSSTQCYVKSWWEYVGELEEEKKGWSIFLNRSCIIIRVAGAAANGEPTSSALTNLVFPGCTKDQPLDKSVFIRKEGDPSLFINLALAIIRSLFSVAAFLSTNVRHSFPPVFLIDKPVAYWNSNFAPSTAISRYRLYTRSNQSTRWSKIFFHA